ncbi:type I glyceraldehyde-3-phosphate dehydrogenase [Myxococcus sp. MISCRS1]|jgi:glyceraldehyde 3-phosphate dehydrogenase|uniref:type I glyceraldehyde-3-phosphate dehydrogenase n=1 Tax=Myxococcus TaxID=32 RepID=UPI001142BE4F|nr:MULTISPECIES: type I glyceraldehyde-3-phosphate dehydrogenase [Myxococcus]BDT33737.1 type I glyceraldehyde-3-phosphate dehydrogenase [Myxococcus sp. MH1]MBZ4396637.1 type I glyceraldehyde-3-phosphate dehydrogenase [Myxococcus sp. AS-1-15]MBZ4408638.1 type I glyceraldehyde-3-phosphate dehydrogenase [Myxococcus sp. XM-1-1-1]MCK8496585.1 type I glyceraldehyde-3-phosphate dehydrogenase [Myxococcus fulvus]MCY0996241.1 type I glyceraldehyde-3-phosphate dehydrogenase [Myxococcus sp. MISCRS1]
MATRIAINGFGRIGRCILRAALSRKEDLEIVAINDLDKPAALAHLFKYDSVHRTWPGEVKATDKGIVVDGKEIIVTAEKDPTALPWKSLNVDVVLECTGRFTGREGAEKHLKAGAKKVLISAPAKGPDLTIAYGINHGEYDASKHHIISNASCTTNCLAPIAKVLVDNFGIEKGLMTTVHSYTNDQRILDLTHEDMRRARAAALSMIPTSTGAAKAIGEVIPQLKGKMHGLAVRVPTPNVSLVDLTVNTEKKITQEAVVEAYRAAAAGPLKGILEFSDAQTVSVDYNGNPHSAIFDSTNCFVMGDNMLKVMAWYDNEWGFSNRMVDTAKFLVSKGV